MMSAPDHFEVAYRINPWMDPGAWQPSALRLHHDARQGWQRLKDKYESLGARVDVQHASKGLPDMVFTANAAMVLDRKVLLARFVCEERRGEEAHNRAFFAAQKARGVIDGIIETPDGLFFEGAGDAHWDPRRGVIWTGYGQRSSREMQFVIGKHYAVPVVALELVDPRFYHLDTCFSLLSRGEVLYYPPAFSVDALAQLEELVGRDRLIEASDEDAHNLAVNLVCIGDDLVLCHASDALRAQLGARGYRVHVVPLDSFNRSGGAAYCLTLRLDLATRAAMRGDDALIEADLIDLRAA
jgi:N-dimethylarginine dimethylaminohydrolase